MNHSTLKSLKDLLKVRRKFALNKFVIERDLAEKQLIPLLSNNTSFIPQGCNVNTVSKGVEKYLHWFEWEKKDIHLYDVVNNTHKTLRLFHFIDIPAFSRSIMIPDGNIFLMGGETNDGGAKKEVYLINVVKDPLDRQPTSKKSMLAKKYDFSICYHNKYIYTICGKGSEREVVNTCERYCVETNTWFSISPAIKKRYAASASVATEVDKIFLFGGRSELNNSIVEEIEEYNITNDIWSIVVLKNKMDFIPVEVCASIQIGINKIMIFGGNDDSITDTKSSFLFKYEDSSISKLTHLKKAHVFVSSPFLYGSHVYAIGNEYYVKHRSIHRFNITTSEWDIIF